MRVALLLIALLPAVALAGSYQNAYESSSYCSNVAGMARAVYQGKQAGEVKQRYLDIAAKALETGNKGAMITRYAIDYGYDMASDAKDAYMGTWSWCMDRLR